MGRETLETLPGGRPLPGRTDIVLSGNKNYEVDCQICASMDSALEAVERITPERMFSSLAALRSIDNFLPCCSEIYVTKIEESFPADKYFENLDLLQEWKITEQSDVREYNGLQYSFVTYTRQTEPQVDCCK